MTTRRDIPAITSRATLDRRNEKRGPINVRRSTVEALRAAAKAKGWTMERMAEAAIWAALGRESDHAG